jgi:pyrroloquinoline-quinone synthase
MTDFWARLDEVRAANDVLEHPFYVRWTKGELSREELATYAGEYRYAVVALADATELAAERDGSEELRRHADEERSHVELWDRFAEEVGGDVECDPAPESAACADSWTRGDGLLDHLVTLYAIEAAQPAIAKVKRDGLVDLYGIEPGPGTEYFDLHAELDHEHAAEGRELIAARLEGADQDALIDRARETLAANWHLLDGVERLAG